MAWQRPTPSIGAVPRPSWSQLKPVVYSTSSIRMRERLVAMPRMMAEVVISSANVESDLAMLSSLERRVSR